MPMMCPTVSVHCLSWERSEVRFGDSLKASTFMVACVALLAALATAAVAVLLIWALRPDPRPDDPRVID